VQRILPGLPGTVPRCIARELGELTTASLLYPLGCTALGIRSLLRVLVPAPQPAAVRHHTPTFLVHGYGGNNCSWFPLEQRLMRAGFSNIHTPSYNSVIMGVPDMARALVEDCRAAMRAVGTEYVQLVGHSLGGIVIRYAIQRLGLAPHVRTAVTVASPHRGTRLALLALGGAAASVRPGSSLLEDLRRTSCPSRIRWVAYYSDSDLVVRPSSARLQESVLRAENFLVPDVGHLGILRAALFLDSVVPRLIDNENLPREMVAVSLRPERSAAAA
jgi:predicted alpha/beta hydrolase family esterase